jgi:hypothetical protein
VNESSYIVGTALFPILGDSVDDSVYGEIETTIAEAVRWPVTIPVDRSGRDPDHPKLDKFLKGLEP